MGLRTPTHRSYSQMRTGLVNLVLSFLAVILFWSYHCADRGQTNTRWFESQKQVFTYRARGINKSIQLFSHELLRWISAKGLDVIDSPLRQIVYTVIGSFCHLGTHESSTNLYQKCCLQSGNLMDEDEAVWCLQQLGSIGSLPTVREAQNGSRIIPPEAPNFVHPPMYFDEAGAPEREINCHVKLTKRKKVYKLLRHWISLAERYGIVWWLSFGSLLGSVRHKDFIPYDHDIDIAVLGSYEDVLRSLSITWRKVNYNETFLITRQGSYCINDHGPRLNCQGVPVRYQLDPCAFCTPFGRLISSYFAFLDIFVVHARATVDLINASNTGVGLLDESVDMDSNKAFSYPLDYVFPLSTCIYMGLSLPCPRKPDLILSYFYGKDYLKPSKLCSQRFGVWYNT